jgi:hypothetical protein
MVNIRVDLSHIFEKQKAEMDLLIRQSAEWISQNSNHVKVNKDEIKNIALKLMEKMKLVKYSFKNWHLHPLHPKVSELTPNWIFLIDLLNFSFWHERSDLKPYTVAFDGVDYTVWYAIIVGILVLVCPVATFTPVECSNYRPELLFELPR